VFERLRVFENVCFELRTSVIRRERFREKEGKFTNYETRFRKSLREGWGRKILETKMKKLLTDGVCAVTLLAGVF